MTDIDGMIHKTGFWGLLRTLEKSQRPFDNVNLVIPPVDVDLKQLSQTLVTEPAALQSVDELRYDVRRKHHLLQEEFVGQSELFLLHAMLISILRRRNPPQTAIDLFHRIWLEQGSELASDLPVRWLISAATTFSDCGTSPSLRAGGMALSIMFDLIKLHDTERRASGQPGYKAFRRKKGRKQHKLAFDMMPYSLDAGDLDRIMLARLWKLCEEDEVLRPLGTRMLKLVMSDPRSVFARIQFYRRKKEHEIEPKA